MKNFRIRHTLCSKTGARMTVSLHRGRKYEVVGRPAAMLALKFDRRPCGRPTERSGRVVTGSVPQRLWRRGYNTQAAVLDGNQ